jgi:hypothetical protein
LVGDIAVTFGRYKSFPATLFKTSNSISNKTAAEHSILIRVVKETNTAIIEMSEFSYQ